MRQFVFVKNYVYFCGCFQKKATKNNQLFINSYFITIMKKISLLFVMLLALAGNAMAQSTVPVPADPALSEWYDYTPHQSDGSVTVASAWLFIDGYGTDIMGNQVANDYALELDSCFNDELLYTILDKDKFSYSIYTDFDELYVFYPEEYPEFTEPTTNIYPYLLLFDDYNDQDTYHSTANIEFWGPHFPNKTTQVEGFEGMERFPLWRIGIQTHYTVDGVTSSSNIVYLELCDKPVTKLGDVNMDDQVNIKDVTVLINYLLTGTEDPFNKFNADVNDNNNINISDVTALIDLLITAAN